MNFFIIYLIETDFNFKTTPLDTTTTTTMLFALQTLHAYLFHCSTIYSGKQLFCKARDDTNVVSLSHDTKKYRSFVQKLFKNWATIYFSYQYDFPDPV